MHQITYRFPKKFRGHTPDPRLLGARPLDPLARESWGLCFQTPMRGTKVGREEGRGGPPFKISGYTYDLAYIL